ncbi:MAG TPA: methyltransferase domain-containing protein, partial [Candidatus Edwardsbacteria bacterium]|nr:methyltransferase domain-containing protein [Candidatus Edwardsbacteria bacterium]
ESFHLKMLNREAADIKNKPLEVVNLLELRKGDVVYDVGSGGGYFSLEFAQRTGPGGKVYTIDTNPRNLDFIRKQSAAQQLANVHPFRTRAASDLAGIRDKADLVFLRNVFHHLPKPAEYFQALAPCLADGGRIAVIEYAKKGPGFITLFGHYTPEQRIVETLAQCGLARVARFDILPKQSFNVFKKS